MRKYQPAWNNLKALPEGEPLRLAAPPEWHPRILKAIIKEKDMDILFKYTQSELGRKAVISHSKQKGMLVLRLRFTIGYNDL